MLGVDDPEMIEIERMLKARGKEFYYATKNGARVHPGNAYEADPISVPKDTTLVLIECEPKELETGVKIKRIDHHRPGDHGHHARPEHFWKASAIGQLYKLLGGMPTYHHRVVAAMDHCMVHARKGKCPGIEPHDVQKLSVAFIAHRKNITEHEVKSCMGYMYDLFSVCSAVTLGDIEVLDSTFHPLDIDSKEYLCARDALVDMERAALIALRNPCGDPAKIVFYGDTTEKSIKAFVSEWAPAHELENVYWDLARGYAGGYRSTIPMCNKPTLRTSISL